MREISQVPSRTIGFDNRKKHSNLKRHIQIARKLEYGNLGIPARPLFRLVYLVHEEEYLILYKKILKGGG